MEYGCGLDGADSSEAWVEITESGVTVGSSWEDHGQGADMGSMTVAHEALRPLGMKPEQIKLVMNDTEKTPNSGPAGGSRSNVMTGNAIRVACENLIAALKREDGTYRTYQEMITEKTTDKIHGHLDRTLHRMQRRNRTGQSVSRIYVTVSCWPKPQ